MLKLTCFIKIIAILISISISLNAFSKNLKILNVNIVDVETGNVKNNQHILIKNGVIDTISEKPIFDNKEAKTINGTDQYLIPGLIDSHVHYFQSGGLYTRPDALDLKHVKSYKTELKEIKRDLNDTFSRYLRSGITSTLDAGGPMWNFNVREQAAGVLKSPNIKVAGPLLSTNYTPKGLESDDLAIVSVKDFEQAKPIIDKQIKQGTDLIKIWFIRRDNRSLNEHKPLVESIINEAHKHNVRVAVHATELASAKLAVALGADILVHGIRDEIVDKSFIDTLLKNQVVYIPTLQVVEGYRRTFTQQFDFKKSDFEIANPFVMSSLFDLKVINKDKFTQGLRDYMASKPEFKLNEIEIKNLLKLQKSGVIIATGTDAGNIGTLPGSSYFREVELMSNSGMSALEILQASTIGGAHAMAMTDQIGVIKEGFNADLVLLKKNPLKNIENISSIVSVIKSGELFISNEILDWSAAQVVHRQVNTYNARDIEAFLDTYSDDIEIYRLKEGKPVLSFKGKDVMRTRYTGLFDRFPELHCEVLNRQVVNEFTIKDHERVTGLNGESLEAFATYTVKGGVITKVVFSKS